MAKTIRWGIIGAGHIAAKFAYGLKAVPDAELVAIGSRTEDKAEAFAKEFDIRRAHGSYDKLANDPDVDVVYIATPHTFHMENTLLCIKAGKAVLCEKPFTINAAQAERMVEAAGKAGVFLMEAMWTRFLPLVIKIRQWLKEELVGPVHILQANLGFGAHLDPQSRGLNLELGGGALLDLGVYPISFASMVFGQTPQAVTGLADLGPTGADEQSAMILRYSKGQLALLACAFKTQMLNGAVIYGSKGTIKIHPSFGCPEKATILLEGKPERTVEMPFESNGYNYEAAEVINCMRAGKLQSDVMPLAETVAIMKTMDELRLQWGLKYPME